MTPSPSVFLSVLSVVPLLGSLGAADFPPAEPATLSQSADETQSADEPQSAQDLVADFQAQAIADGNSNAAHWGVVPEKYTQWGTHSNRLVPVYTFGTAGAGDGVDLTSYTGANSVYRSESGVRRLYGYVPEGTVNESAQWLDQTNIADLQRAALAAGKRHVFLVVFDGMDWQTTQAAAIVNRGEVGYTSGRGTGTRFQSYTADGTTQYGFMVTSPHNDGTKTNVDNQTVVNPGGTVRGGYAATAGGDAPWQTAPDMGYLIGKPSDGFPRHAYTDSASSATSMTAGIKTYNNAINVDPSGQPVPTVFHEAQEAGFRIGVVSSVPVSLRVIRLTKVPGAASGLMKTERARQNGHV